MVKLDRHLIACDSLHFCDAVQPEGCAHSRCSFRDYDARRKSYLASLYGMINYLHKGFPSGALTRRSAH